MSRLSRSSIERIVAWVMQETGVSSPVDIIRLVHILGGECVPVKGCLYDAKLKVPIDGDRFVNIERFD